MFEESVHENDPPPIDHDARAQLAWQIVQTKFAADGVQESATAYLIRYFSKDFD